MWVKINVLVAPPIAQGTGCARAGRHCPQDQTSVARYGGTTGQRQAARGSAVSCQAPLPTDVSLNISSRLSPVMKMRRMPSGLLTRKCPLLMRRLSVLRLMPRAWAASCREYTAADSMAILSLTIDLLPGSASPSQARTRPKTCNGRECDTGRMPCQGKPAGPKGRQQLTCLAFQRADCNSLLDLALEDNIDCQCRYHDNRDSRKQCGPVTFVVLLVEHE